MVVTKDCSKDYCCSHPKVCCQEAGESEVVITMYSYPYLLNPPLPHSEEFRQESMPELIQPVSETPHLFLLHCASSCEIWLFYDNYSFEGTETS